MWQRFLIFLIILSLISDPTLLLAGSIPTPGMSCDGSQMPDGTFIPAGQVREITYGGVRYRCVGCGSCTPISSGSSGSTSSTYIPYVPSYGTTSQQLAIGLMGAFLSGFFSSLFSSAFDNKSAYDNRSQREYEEQQRRLAEEQKRQEERKKQLLAQYNSLITQAKAAMQSVSNQSSSPLTFQTLGGQLTPFQWQSAPSAKPEQEPSSNDLFVLNVSDMNKIFGNVIQEKAIEEIEEKIDDYGGKLIEKLDEKYGKNWGSKYYERGLPIVKIAVTAKTEGAVQAAAETIDYGISLIPIPTVAQEVFGIGKKIYTKVAFTALDKFLTETEKACDFFGLNCDKEEFWQKTEKEMNTAQKIVYKWLGGR